MEKTVTISENRVELPELATLFAGLLTTTDYKETATACDALLLVALDNPVTFVRCGDRIRVLLNSANRKTLASGIVDAIRHYFGDPSHTPANTADPAIIIERATAWAQSQPDADWLNPHDYAGFVAMIVNDLLEKNNPTLSLKPKRFDEAERNAIVDKVQEWYETKMEQPSNAQPLNDADPDRHPADSVPAVPDKKMNKRNRKVEPTVNADGLKKYFTMRFQNSGNFAYLVGDLADLRTVKDCATVAGMVYSMSKNNYIKSHSTFAAWCRAFFVNIAVSVPLNYNYSKRPQPTDELKRKFYYLE